MATREGMPSPADGEDIIIDLRDHAASPPVDLKRVPFLDLKQQHLLLEAEIIERWSHLLRNGAFIGGAAVQDFEQALATFVGSPMAVGVANGTDALMLSLKALDVGPGDEVITAANTFFATVEAISHAGAQPVLADVDPHTALIDPEAIEAAITDRTRCIIPVHLYGQPADMDAIQRIADRHDLVVIEDNAQAIGARYRGQRTGTFGNTAGYSFYPGKNLGATGDGGAVTTSSVELADRIRMLADHGMYEKYVHVAIGHNSRLDALHAAALTVKLRYIDHWNTRRAYIADRYRSEIDVEGVAHPERADERSHVWHLYVVRVEDRAAFREVLDRRGVATGMHYPTPIHQTAPYDHLGADGQFPIAEDWARRGVSLPIFPEMTDDQIDMVVSAVPSYQEARRVLARDSA